jgi:hypothetical protein
VGLPRRYEEWILEKVPWWLRDTWGEKFFRVVGAHLDLAWETVHEATKARFAKHAPSDALAYGVKDADVPVFLALDTEGEIRNRVRDPWGWHEREGTEPGCDATLAILGLDPDATWVLDSSNGPHWFTEGWWSTFAVASRNPLGWGVRTDTWDDLEASGLTWAEWEASGACWDYTCPASLFTQLREWLWTRKWTHAVPAYVVISFGDGHTWDSLAGAGVTWNQLAGDGLLWDELAAADALVIQTARFWDAMNLEDGNAPLTWDQLAAMGVRWSRCMTTRD